MSNMQPEPFPMTIADQMAATDLQRLKRHPASQRFHDICDLMKALHDRKQQDYGRDDDPFANVRGTEEWGQPGWVGAMIRATDKLRRLQKVARGGTLANEGVEDSFMDLAVYAVIGLVLWKQDKEREFEQAAEPMIRWDQPQQDVKIKGKFVPSGDGKMYWVTE